MTVRRTSAGSSKFGVTPEGAGAAPTSVDDDINMDRARGGQDVRWSTIEEKTIIEDGYDGFLEVDGASLKNEHLPPPSVVIQYVAKCLPSSASFLGRQALWYVLGRKLFFLRCVASEPVLAGVLAPA